MTDHLDPLRRMLETAEGEAYEQVRRLLIIGLAEQAEGMDPTDPSRAAVVREGLGLSREDDADTPHVARARRTLESLGVQYEPADDGSNQTVPAGPTASAGPAPADVKAVLSGVSLGSAGFSLDHGSAEVAQFRSMVGMARSMLPTLPPGSPMHAQLRLVLGFNDGLEALSSGRWTADQDSALATLQEDAAAAGPGLQPELAAMIPVLLVMMRTARAHSLLQSPDEADHPAPAELADLAADLESLASRAGSLPIPGATALPRTLRFMAAYFLIVLSGRDPETGRPRSGLPSEQQGDQLRRARGYLRDPPPEFAGEAKSLLNLLDVDASVDSSGSLDDAAVDAFEETIDVYPDVAAIGLVQLAMQRAAHARMSRDPADLGDAIDRLRDVRVRLAAGDPQHAAVLAALANLLGLRATLSLSATDNAEAISAGIEAVRAAEAPSVEVAGHLAGALSSGVILDQRDGPFEQAEEVLGGALAAAEHAGTGDLYLVPTLLIGIGSARLLQWRRAHDPADQAAARAALDQAEQRLPEPDGSPVWIGLAMQLLQVNAYAASFGGDTRAAAAATALIERVERLLDSRPDLGRFMAENSRPGGLSGLGLTSDANGIRQTLGAMRALVNVSGGLAGNPFAQALSQPGFNRAQIDQLLDRMRSGGMPGFDLNAVNDPNAMAKMAAQMMRDNPDLIATMMSGLLPPAAPTPAPPTPGPPAKDPAPDYAQILRDGLAEASAATGLSRRPPRRLLDPADPVDPARLRAALGRLREGLAGGVRDADVVQRARVQLGLGLAELGFAGEPDAASGPDPAATLKGAVATLGDALSLMEHRLPTVERAELIAVQARCQRKLVGASRDPAGARRAEHLARASIAELRRCVMLAEDRTTALAIADRATGIVGRAIGWCLEDGRTEAAIGLAEAGRSLLLASLTIAGRVADLLRRNGRTDLVEGWLAGDEQARTEGLAAASATVDGQFLMSAPGTQQIAATLVGSAAPFDAVVYLVPASAEVSGHALLVRPGFEIEAVPLPDARTGPDSPVTAYAEALAQAVTEVRRSNTSGFTGTIGGARWEQALDEVGAWAYETVVGPLLAHVGTWALDRPAHLSIIPLGALVAVPLAGAWTLDPSQPGGRRYAIDDLVVSYTASARMLIEVASRPRPPLLDRVDLVSDATGAFPFSRRGMRKVGARYLAAAEAPEGGSVRIFGRRDGDPQAPAGAMTTARLLAAMLGDGPGQPPASLLHLTTHGTDEPVAQLQTADGWLTLDEVLSRGRQRPPHAAGGLLITTACLTDHTGAQLDEAVTLSTTMLAAFATGVVGTRWPIDDEINEAFVERLHERLLAGEAPASALREAQRSMLHSDDSRLARPAAWAAYVHHGR